MLPTHLFYGKHHHSVDSKGRVAIPSGFRRKIGPESDDTVILHVRANGAIRCHPAADWTSFWEAALPEITRYQEDSDDARGLLGDVEEVKLDGQGRVLIPRMMTEEAGIGTDVVIAGAGEFFEIWDRQRHQEYRSKNAEPRRKAMAEAERRMRERRAARSQAATDVS